MKVALTGSRGFIGKNLQVHLARRDDLVVMPILHDDADDLVASLEGVDFVVHLAGVNRPKDQIDFQTGNVDFTESLINGLTRQGRPIPVLYASSSQAEYDNAYGRTKRNAEQKIERYAASVGAPALIYRLPNVFGKWSRPNYNSAVSTFCHNIARDLSITINDAEASLSLVYVDDVVEEFVAALDGKVSPDAASVKPVYETTVGQVADQLRAFHASRANLVTERVGAGLTRALYATYLSYLPPAAFCYEVPTYRDPRGIFVEMLKTMDSGQFSFFSAGAGVTRGGHYHHSKTEKFLVIQGAARFRFRHIVSDETVEFFTSADRPQVVETIPGWSHDITNIGEGELLALLWANEIFDRSKPDTFSHAV